MQIALAPAGSKAVAVVNSKHKTPSLRRYRRRWVQNRFGLSEELANIVADLAFANQRGRL